MEFHILQGEQTAAIILACPSCGQRNVIRSDQIMTTRPIPCEGCNVSRFISYREYIDILNRFSVMLLEFDIRKRTGGTTH